MPGEKRPCDSPVGVWEPEPPSLPPSKGSFIGVLIADLFFFSFRLVIYGRFETSSKFLDHQFFPLAFSFKLGYAPRAEAFSVATSLSRLR